MTTTFHGVHGDLALFSAGTQAVLVNVATLDVFDPKSITEFSIDDFVANDGLPSIGLLSDLAAEALPPAIEDISIVSATKPRSYRVPKAVQQNATYALMQIRRGRTVGEPVAMNTARALSRGGSLELTKIKNMARFFAITSAELAQPNQTSWELFGGDAGRRWSLQVAAQHSSIAAAAADASTAPEVPPVDDISDEEMPIEDAEPDFDPSNPHVFFGIEGLTNVCVECAGAEDADNHIELDQLPADHPQRDYLQSESDVSSEDAMSEPVTASVEESAFPEGAEFFVERHPEDEFCLVEVYYGVNGKMQHFNAEQRQWEDFKSPEYSVETDVIPVDEDLVLAMVRSLTENPADTFDVRHYQPEEAEMAVRALDAAIDEVENFAELELYTPQERSANASKQIRDRNGKFARTGTNVTTDGNRKGRVVGSNPQTGQVEVKMDDTGRSEFFTGDQIAVNEPGNIGAKPRATAATPKARLSQEHPILEGEAVGQLIDQYQTKIAAERERNQKSENLATVEPASSDVKPLYVAIVDDLDPTAVLDLVAIMPKGPDTTEVTAFKREDKKWVEDDNLLLSLKSVTPPKVVTLDDATYQDVVKQVDSYVAGAAPAPEPAPAQPTAAPAPAAAPAAVPQPMAASAEENVDLLPAWGEYGELIPVLAAAGGLDQNRGNAETLRRYWLYGPGAAKIVWGAPGDWTRCVAQLSKYLGVRAKGYCNLRHKDANGFYPGDHRNLGIEDDDAYTEMVVTAAATRAVEIATEDGVKAPDSAADVQEGARFRIPMALPIGVETGDGRKFLPGSLSLRDFPLPLMWQIETGEKHDGSVIAGRIDSANLTDKGIVDVQGVFDTGIYGREAERLVRNKFLRGVSADLDKFEASIVEDNDESLGEKDQERATIAPPRMDISSGRLTGMTLVPKPAFQEVSIELEDQSEEPMKVEDGVYTGTPDDADARPLAAAALIAAGIPVDPPASWFEDPVLREPTPLEIDANGRVFGHIAAWHVDHIGLPFSQKPPKSRTGYAYFHTGELKCDDGEKVAVGQLTLAGGHAPLHANAAAAVRHYDDTASAVADVHAGEDEHGIWVAGALRPNVTPEQIRVLRASAPSGDWRPINGKLEMVAVCQVNVPGFPTVRARVASGQMYALVAAGAAEIARLRPDPIDVRLAAVEHMQSVYIRERMAEVSSRVRPLVTEHKSAMTAALDAARDKMTDLTQTESELFADISTDMRKKYAKQGKALDDGSYPIPDVAHLQKAIMAYGRSSPEDRAKVRRHIIKCARKLGRTDLIPEKWTSASVEERYQDIRHTFYAIQNAELLADRAEAAAKFAELAEGVTDRTKKLISRNPDFDKEAHPRDSEGKFRDVVARLRDELKTVPDAREAVNQLDEAQKHEAAKNFDKAHLAAARAFHILDLAGQNKSNLGDVNTMRAAAKQLGRVIAYLPVAVGVDTVAYSFGQFPDEVQKMIRGLIKRADAVKDKSDDQKQDLGILKSFVSGADQWTQAELNKSLSRMIRLLI